MIAEQVPRYKSGHSKSKLKKYRRDWQDNHRNSGLCLDCNEKAVHGKRRCQTHLDNQVEFKKNQRKQNKIVWYNPNNN